MPSYKGHCHCGDVSFEFTTEQPIDGGTRCTCSICVRKGAMMSNEFIDEASLKVNQPKESLGMYQFGDKKGQTLLLQNLRHLPISCDCPFS